MESVQFSQGRAPWYNTKNGETREPFVIGIAGGTASGKTTVCRKVLENLGLPWVVVLSTDSFYKGLTKEQHENVSEYNFDHPDAFDFDLLREKLATIREGKSVEIPVYDFVTHSRRPETETIYGADVVVVEGILSLYHKDIRDLLDLMVFVDADSDLRLARRIKRDIAERGRTLDSVLAQYVKTVKPSHDNFCTPTKRYCDIIIPHGRHNPVAIDLLTEHIRTQLSKRGVDFRPENLPETKRLIEKSTQINVMKSSSLIKSIHTVLRDRSTLRDDFVFHTDRLCRLIIEFTLELNCFERKDVETPTGETFRGLESVSQICGVSVVRSGEAMEAGLRAVHEVAPIGKILIQQQRDKSLGPRLHYCRLPRDIARRRVLLMDAVVGTGNSAMMAVVVLLDHGVPLDRIVFVCMLAAPEGLCKLTRAFPELQIVTSCVDDGLDNSWFVRPGIGFFGDRYFGSERND